MLLESVALAEKESNHMILGPCLKSRYSGNVIETLGLEKRKDITRYQDCWLSPSDWRCCLAGDEVSCLGSTGNVAGGKKI